VPLQKEVTHPHKRLQHLAGRFLLQFLFPDFPYELIRIADTRKPYLPGEQYHFSISHCGDYAAAIVSSNQRVGIDIEIPSQKVERIKEKFLNDTEFKIFNLPRTHDSQLTTLLWSAKESVFKWHGNGKVDFRQHIQLIQQHEGSQTIDCFFAKTNEQLIVQYRRFDHLILAWVIS
jgi:phosphopantetheinyl transferase